MSVGYDIGLSSSLSLSPQGSVGGGNVFNAAPLFGDWAGIGGGSSGDNPASTPGGNAAAAAKGSTADAGPTLAAAVSGLNLQQYVPYLLLAAAAFAVVWLVSLFLKK